MEHFGIEAINWEQVAEAILPQLKELPPNTRHLEWGILEACQSYIAATSETGSQPTKQQLMEESKKIAGRARKLRDVLSRERSDVQYEPWPGFTLTGSTIATIIDKVADIELDFRELIYDFDGRRPNEKKALGVRLFLLGNQQLELSLTSTRPSSASRATQPPSGPSFDFVRVVMSFVGIEPTPTELEEWSKEARKRSAIEAERAAAAEARIASRITEETSKIRQHVGIKEWIARKKSGDPRFAISDQV